MREGSETISKESRTFVRSGDRHSDMDEDIVQKILNLFIILLNK